MKTKLNKQKEPKLITGLKKIHVPVNDNQLLEQALEIINNNQEINTLWKVMNVNALERLKMTDHGPVHFQIVANGSLRLLRLLLKKKVEMSITKDFGLSHKYAELVVLLASLLHDLGMSINREGHEEFSLFLANSLLREIVNFLPIEEKTIVISEVLHAIINHRSGGRPLTIEGGIVRVADALDMSQGRSRIPYNAGQIEIHSVSAFAIDKVEIHEGEKKPILIVVFMNNIAGIYQVDELLKSKLSDSGIEDYIQVQTFLKEGNKKKLIKEFV
jgi:hypothetical protein